MILNVILFYAPHQLYCIWNLVGSTKYNKICSTTFTTLQVLLHRRAKELKKKSTKTGYSAVPNYCTVPNKGIQD